MKRIIKCYAYNTISYKQCCIIYAFVIDIITGCNTDMTTFKRGNSLASHKCSTCMAVPKKRE